MADRSASLPVPPHNLEAEQGVLGSMVLDNASIGEVLEFVDASSFYKAAHREMFQAITALFERGEAVDLVTLREELLRRSLPAELRLEETLVAVADSVPSSANAAHYARIVRDKKLLRDVLRAARETLAEVQSSGEDARRVLDDAEQRLFEIARRGEGSETSHIREILSRTFDRLDRMQEGGGKITGIPTGFYDLDDLTCGLQPSELIIVAGRPSMGKTSFALSVADHIGTVEGGAVAIFSLEMVKDQVANNLLCSRAGVDSRKLRLGRVEDEDWKRMLQAASELHGAPLFIDDTPGLSLMMLRAKARRLVAQHQLKLIIVDYLQLMEAPRAENRQQEISRLSRGLKMVARELELPVLVLSQLNRAVDHREDHRPRMSDLRESGSIEQDADLVCFLYRAEYYEETEDNKGVAEVIVAKQRNGPVGTLRLQFQAECMRFHNLTFQRA